MTHYTVRYKPQIEANRYSPGGVAEPRFAFSELEKLATYRTLEAAFATVERARRVAHKCSHARYYLGRRDYQILAWESSSLVWAKTAELLLEERPELREVPSYLDNVQCWVARAHRPLVFVYGRIIGVDYAIESGERGLLVAEIVGRAVASTDKRRQWWTYDDAAHPLVVTERYIVTDYPTGSIGILRSTPKATLMTDDSEIRSTY